MIKDQAVVTELLGQRYFPVDAPARALGETPSSTISVVHGTGSTGGGRRQLTR